MRSNRKDIIRRAAVEVISQKGFYNTRMQDIADQADMAVGTIYNYFSSKDDVLEYIFRTEMDRRLLMLKKLAKKKNSKKEFLEEFLEKHLTALIDNQHLGRVLVREKDFSKRGENGKIQEFMQTIINNLEEIFRSGIDQGEIKNIDPHLMAIFFFGSMQGVIEHALTEGEIEILEKAPSFIMERIDHIFIRSE